MRRSSRAGKPNGSTLPGKVSRQDYPFSRSREQPMNYGFCTTRIESGFRRRSVCGCMKSPMATRLYCCSADTAGFGWEMPHGCERRHRFDRFRITGQNDHGSTRVGPASLCISLLTPILPGFHVGIVKNGSPFETDRIGEITPLKFSSGWISDDDQRTAMRRLQTCEARRPPCARARTVASCLFP